MVNFFLKFNNQIIKIKEIKNENIAKINSSVNLAYLHNFSPHAQDVDKTRTLIEQAYNVFNSYQFDKMSDYIDENYVEHSPDPGQKQGLSGLKEEFEKMKKGFPDYKFTINDIVVNPTADKASVLFTFTGTNTGDMMGMKGTGKSVSVQGIDYLYFKNGKCTEHWGYMDMNAMMQQLGMMPPPKDKKD